MKNKKRKIFVTFLLLSLLLLLSASLLLYTKFLAVQYPTKQVVYERLNEEWRVWRVNTSNDIVDLNSQVVSIGLMGKVSERNVRELDCRHGVGNFFCKATCGVYGTSSTVNLAGASSGAVVFQSSTACFYAENTINLYPRAKEVNKDFTFGDDIIGIKLGGNYETKMADAKLFVRYYPPSFDYLGSCPDGYVLKTDTVNCIVSQLCPDNYDLNETTKICSPPNECDLEEGEILVFDRFGENKSVNKFTLTYEPLRYCDALPPLVINEKTMKITRDTNILNILKNDLTYTVPPDEAVGIYYIAVKPISLTTVCKTDEVYVAKEGICVGTTGIVTPCVNGILSPDGTCFVQPKINFICEGQLQILSDGSQVCNIIIPTREEYICTFLNGTKAKISNPNDCTENVTLEKNVILETRYFCGGVEVKSKDDCVTTLQVQYLCNGKLVKNADDCTENLELKYYCNGELVNSADECKSVLNQRFICSKNGKTFEVEKPEDCNERLELKLFCGEREINNIDECKKEVIPETVIKCVQGKFDENIGKCVIKGEEKIINNPLFIIFIFVISLTFLFGILFIVSKGRRK